MKQKWLFAAVIACVVIAGALVIGETVFSTGREPDLIEIGRIKLAAERAASDADFAAARGAYDFTVVSADGSVLYSTVETEELSLAGRIDRAITRYDTVIDFEPDGQTRGKIIVYTGSAIRGSRAWRIAAVAVPFAVLLALLTLYYFYTHIRLFKPFKRLKNFAGDIAAGNLDLPLPMDKDNLFGEFTESFDLMREELKAAQSRAVREEQSKKELIASLTHDLKTPVAVVRAASHLLEINEKDPERLQSIDTIKEKTSEIDTLLSDLFTSALDELTELKVETAEIPSHTVEGSIKNADRAGKVRMPDSAPDCLIKADPLRLNQVVGNIVNNSYKYAGTGIEVRFALNGMRLDIRFKDFGTSLKKEDLFHLTDKYYRGKNTAGKEGAGLGLYICKKLLEKMDGALDFELTDDGFTAVVSVALS